MIDVAPSKTKTRHDAARSRPSTAPASLTKTQVLGSHARTVGRRVWPQWLRTFLVAFFLLGITPAYVALVAPYVAYNSAATMYVGLVIAGAVAAHLWPTKTSPWRTLMWAVMVSSFVGATLLPFGWGRAALVSATIVGFGIVALRVNQNGRKLWRLVKTWRAVR